MRPRGCGVARLAALFRREACHEPSEPVDRAFEWRRHLERAFERREHRDQIAPGLHHPRRPIDDLCPADVDAVTELTHVCSELDQLDRAAIKPFPERHDRLGPLVQPLSNLQHPTSNTSDLLAKLEDPIELTGRRTRKPGDRAEVGQNAVDDRLGRLDGEAQEAQHRSQ